MFARGDEVLVARDVPGVKAGVIIELVSPRIVDGEPGWLAWCHVTGGKFSVTVPESALSPR